MLFFLLKIEMWGNSEVVSGKRGSPGRGQRREGAGPAAPPAPPSCPLHACPLVRVRMSSSRRCHLPRSPSGGSVQWLKETPPPVTAGSAHGRPSSRAFARRCPAEGCVSRVPGERAGPRGWGQTGCPRGRRSGHGGMDRSVNSVDFGSFRGRCGAPATGRSGRVEWSHPTCHTGSRAGSTGCEPRAPS